MGITLIFGLGFYCPEYSRGYPRDKALACFGGSSQPRISSVVILPGFATRLCRADPYRHQAIRLGRVYDVTMLTAHNLREPLPPHRLASGLGAVYTPTMRFGSCLFNLYAEYIMRNAGLEETQAGIKIARRNVNNLIYANDTTLWQKVKRNSKAS